MLWLIVAIFAYLILAVVCLVDKYLLVSHIPNPKIYSFYVGMLGALTLVLVPFVNFYVPEFSQIILSLLAGAFFVYGLFWFYKDLKRFEASRIVPSIGGLIPLFTFGLVYLFSKGKEILEFQGLIAFILLILGSVLITLEKKKSITLKSFQASALVAFLFSLSFVLTKYVYLAQPFWNGFIWIRIGGVLMAMSFLFSEEVRNEIFRERVSPGPKTTVIFISNQLLGGGANVLQSWAIFLAPLSCLSVINALQGMQYVFLLIFTILLSLRFPQILKEEISKKIIFQKVLAILLIGAGLILLSF